MNPVTIHIGAPAGGWRCTAIVMQEYNEILSQNPVSYWFYLDKYGIEGKISKNTDAAEGLKQLIDERAPAGKIEEFLLAVVLPHLSAAQFIILVGNARHEAAKEGRNYVREEISKLLVTE